MRSNIDFIRDQVMTRPFLEAFLLAVEQRDPVILDAAASILASRLLPLAGWETLLRSVMVSSMRNTTTRMDVVCSFHSAILRALRTLRRVLANDSEALQMAMGQRIAAAQTQTRNNVTPRKAAAPYTTGGCSGRRGNETTPTPPRLSFINPTLWRGALRPGTLYQPPDSSTLSPASLPDTPTAGEPSHPKDISAGVTPTSATTSSEAGANAQELTPSQLEMISKKRAAARELFQKKSAEKQQLQQQQHTQDEVFDLEDLAQIQEQETMLLASVAISQATTNTPPVTVVAHESNPTPREVGIEASPTTSQDLQTTTEAKEKIETPVVVINLDGSEGEKEESSATDNDGNIEGTAINADSDSTEGEKKESSDDAA